MYFADLETLKRYTRMRKSMGLDSSKPSETTEQSRSSLSLCRKPYRSFHPEGRSIPPPFTTLKTLKHSGPLGLNQVMKVTACAFLMNDDSCLLTLITFAGPSLRNFRAGFVQCWDLEGDGVHDDSIFTYSPHPTCCFSPNGELVSYILNTGNGHIILAELTPECSLEPFKIDCNTSGHGEKSLLSRVLCCVFSPDGFKAVTVSDVSLESHRDTETNEICLWKVKSKKRMKSIWRISCEVVMPHFAGYVVSCVFSPDSTLIAFSSSLSQLYVLDGKNLELVLAIRTDVVIGNPCCCAFDPCFPHQKLTACFEDGYFKIWFMHDSQVSCIKEIQLVHNPVMLTAFSFSPDGSMIAFGTSHGKVILVEAVQYDILNEFKSETDIGICSVAFAKSCQELAIGKSDGHVHILQLPLKLDLQHMCRLSINKLVPPNQIDCLPLPRNLKAYLLFAHVQENNGVD